MNLPAVIEATASALETFDKRLASLEEDSAMGAAFAEQMVENTEGMQSALRGLEEGQRELREMFVRQGDALDELKSMLGNYVQATQESRRETLKLQSEVRERLKAV